MEEQKSIPTIKAISDDDFGDIKQLNELIKLTNSIPLTLGILFALIFYKSRLKEKTLEMQKIDDSQLYNQLRFKDLQAQIDSLRDELMKNKRDKGDNYDL